MDALPGHEQPVLRGRAPLVPSLPRLLPLLPLLFLFLLLAASAGAGGVARRAEGSRTAAQAGAGAGAGVDADTEAGQGVMRANGAYARFVYENFPNRVLSHSGVALVACTVVGALVFILAAGPAAHILGRAAPGPARRPPGARV